jgi:hypothetical protein
MLLAARARRAQVNHVEPAYGDYEPILGVENNGPAEGFTSYRKFS